MGCLGLASLGLSLVVAAHATAAAIAGAWWGRPRLLRSAELSVLGLAVSLGLAVFCLAHALFTHDFGNAYVAENSSRTMSAPYLLAAVWGGQSGSFLFWAWVHALFSGAVALRHRCRQSALMPWVLAVLAGTSFVYCLISLFAADPFRRLAYPPLDGRGLNPLLLHPLMVLHPPLLYLGMVGMAVPGAFALAALVTGRADGSWPAIVRRWTLLAWGFLSAGLLLGAQWAYVELGWGGYWGWDPVENSSLMPWLAATAFLHGLALQQRRGMLQRWNLAAAVGTHALCILGAFITRSGVLASVHAFGRSRVGPLLLAYLVGILLLAGVLLARRWTALRPARRLESVLSRDAGLLATNLTLVGLLLAVLGGTLHPLVSELVTGTAVEAGPPYFDRMASRLGLPLLGLIGVCAQLDWRRTTPAVAGWRLALPAAAGLVGAALLVAAGVRHGSVLLCVALAAFAATGLVRAAWLYTSAALGAAGPSRLASLSYLVCARRRRSGAWLAHVAVVVLCAGFCGNVFTVGQELLLRRGESAAIAAYRLTLVTLAGREEADRAVTAAAVALHLSSGGTGRSSAQQSLSEGPGAGRFVGSLLPARHYYPSSDQGTTEVAICSALWEDLYLALLGFAEDGSSARFQVLYLPLVRLVWIGGLLCILAALWSLWPGYRRQRCTSGAGRSESSAQDRGRPASTGERGTAGPGAVASRPAGCGSS